MVGPITASVSQLKNVRVPETEAVAFRPQSGGGRAAIPQHADGATAAMAAATGGSADGTRGGRAFDGLSGFSFVMSKVLHLSCWLGPG